MPQTFGGALVFSNTKKIAQQTAHGLLAGHFTLTAWWALKHAGVFDAMLKFETEKNEGLDPLVHAARFGMAPDVLESLLGYLATTSLITIASSQARLTPEGKALLEHEDAVLELVYAYRPVLEAAEHLLARLKTVGPGFPAHRKSDAFTDSQAKRNAAEVYPAILALLTRHKCSHLLDLSCGAGDLLIYLAKNSRNIVGVGVGAEGAAVRRANQAITAAGLEKRLIAVTANPVDVCTDTQRLFDRIGISRQLWDEIDCVLAPSLFSELASKDAAAGIPPGSANTPVTKTLAAIPKNFRHASLLLIEPTASQNFDKNYYAAELALLLRLSKSTPWPPDKWRDLLRQSKLRLLQETPLVTDGLTLFLCKPA